MDDDGETTTVSGFRIETIAARALDEQTTRELHALANEMAAEPYPHFVRHVDDNDLVYLFRSLDGSPVGFHFFKTFGEADGVRYVRGGKLRVHPRARRRGLHIAAGLSVLRRELRRHPQSRVRRLAIVNPFGFVSLVRRLARWEFIGPEANRELHPVVARECATSDYRFDPETGLCHVGIQPTKEQIDGYPPSFWSSELVRTYLSRNPGFRENGTNLALVFDADAANLEAMQRSLAGFNQDRRQG